MLETALAGFHHIKIPVSDPAASRDWYQVVFGFVTEIDFVEDGTLMGVAMLHPGSGQRFAVRRDPARAKALSGYDPVAFAVPSRADLDVWVRHLDDQGIAHSPIIEGHIGWIVAGLYDPDGIEVRLYTLERPG